MIPNLLKGMGITGAIRYNLGEGNDKESGRRKELEPGAVSRSEILGGQNFGFAIDSEARVDLARRLMEFNALPENQRSRTRLVEKDCLHISLAWDPSERPSRQQMQEAATSALKALGMERALAVFFAHHDTPHPHLHIVASRLDPETGRVFASLHDHTRMHAWALRYEREHGFIPANRRELHALVDAVRERDLPTALERLTARKSTFTRTELERAIGYAGLEEKQVKTLAGHWLANGEVIGLRERLDQAIQCYTTREILAAERQIQRDARDLSHQDWHGTPRLTQLQQGEELQLSTEQMNALHHMTGDEGFAMVAGQAGTGKSRTMQAGRNVYEAEGFRVVGLAQTNSVVDGMREDGFQHAETLSRELGLNTDRSQAPAMAWNEKTVVMVDEAAMLPTCELAVLAERAREAQAKLILIGDDHQLSSVDRGGMFTPLRNEHGAAELCEVRRPQNEAERDAVWNQMHKGDYQPALEHFQQQGSLHWHASAQQAEVALARQYAADVRADPSKTRFIIAHSNEAVDRLNALGQQLARDEGRLGAPHALKTADGEREFAAGDRIQFTGNSRSVAQKREGFVNGALGSIAGIETNQQGESRMAVALDNGRKLQFEVGSEKGQFDQFKLGYAGTIYKAQSKSIDHVYPLVSKGWNREAAYVAMTRHRESVSVHVPGEVARDIPQLAAFMGRDDGSKRAASGYLVDHESLMRSGLVLDERPRPARPARPDGPALMQAARAASGLPEPGAGKAAPAPQKQAASPLAPARGASSALKTARAASASGADMAGGIAKAVEKIGGALSEGPAQVVEGLFAGKPEPTREEKVAYNEAQSEARQLAKALAEEERLVRQEATKRLGGIKDEMAVLFPAEGEKDREIERRNRERDEREHGRERGR